MNIAHLACSSYTVTWVLFIDSWILCFLPLNLAMSVTIAGVILLDSPGLSIKDDAPSFCLALSLRTCSLGPLRDHGRILAMPKPPCRRNHKEIERNTQGDQSSPAPSHLNFPSPGPKAFEKTPALATE